MEIRYITNQEIAQKQSQLRTNYLATQKGFSLSGIRRSLGSTFIALGQRIYGRCEHNRQAADYAPPLTIAKGI